LADSELSKATVVPRRTTVLRCKALAGICPTPDL